MTLYEERYIDGKWRWRTGQGSPLRVIDSDTLHRKLYEARRDAEIALADLERARAHMRPMLLALYPELRDGDL